MSNSLSLRQCHFSKQSRILFTKYFQIFSGLMNIYETFFTLHLKYCSNGKRACLCLQSMANGAAAVRFPIRITTTNEG